MIRITIILSEQEKNALRVLANKEFRDPRAQAAFIIRRELEKQGLVERPALESVTDKSIIAARRGESTNEHTAA